MTSPSPPPSDTPATSPAEPRPRSSLRVVALPSEHGGWSLTLEPALLGSIVAPGLAGWLLTLAGLTAFMVRTPLKLAIGDRLRRRYLPRTRLADLTAAAYLAVLAATTVGAAVTSSGPFWIPLLGAAPLMVTQLFFDVRSKGRRLTAEMAGTVGIGSVGAAIVLAGGGTGGQAAAVWMIAAARSVAAIPHVRLQLRRAKHQPFDLRSNDVAQLAAVAIVVGGWASGLIPAVAAVAIVVLSIVHLVAARRPAPSRAAIVGAIQVVLGLSVVVAAGLAIAAP